MRKSRSVSWSPRRPSSSSFRFFSYIRNQQRNGREVSNGREERTCNPSIHRCGASTGSRTILSFPSLCVGRANERAAACAVSPVSLLPYSCILTCHDTIGNLLSGMSWRIKRSEDVSRRWNDGCISPSPSLRVRPSQVFVLHAYTGDGSSWDGGRK